MLAVIVIGIATCSTGGGTADACPQPPAGTPGATALEDAKTKSRFPVLYPCYLPGGERLETTSVTNADPTGRQNVELAFAGPFEMAIRQSQLPPPVSPDPAGASRTTIDLFPNVQAIFIQVNDGSGKALYHLFWTRSSIFYELQAYGPALQQRAILLIARSLE